jgi:NAD(P)-dependent dehydrogenase (short-subunit alcohol dehydrogenase family)
MSVLFDRVAIVTGAVGMLGRRHCQALARAGAHVVVTDLALDECEAFAGQLSAESGVDAFDCAANITDRDSVLALRDEVLDRFGRIDVLVNNAAIDDRFDDSPAAAERSRFETYPLDAWRRMLDVNITGAFLSSQVLGSEMARRGAGSIINIASTYGIVAPDPSLYQRPDGTQAFVKSAAYPCSKAALLALTRYLAAYWGHAGVRVNALSPGGVEAGQESWFVERYAERTPLGRMARPDDYQDALVFLAGDGSRYMTGANLVVDGGFTAW